MEAVSEVDGIRAPEYSSRVARKRVLFENSIVCLVVFVFVVVFLPCLILPVWRVWFFC
jgi:hypothetical protein